MLVPSLHILGFPESFIFPLHFLHKFWRNPPAHSSQFLSVVVHSSEKYHRKQSERLSAVVHFVDTFDLKNYWSKFVLNRPGVIELHFVIASRFEQVNHHHTEKQVADDVSPELFEWDIFAYISLWA